MKRQANNRYDVGIGNLSACINVKRGGAAAQRQRNAAA